MRNIPLGVYVPGDTLVHRTPAGWKFVALLSYILATTIAVKTWPLAVACLAVVSLFYVLARIPARLAVQQTAPVLPVLLVLGAFQWWQRGWEFAAVTVVVLLSSVAAAALLTLTTTIAELMAAIENGLAPFARFGLPVETISLAISLTIRLIPLQLATVTEVLAARKARGAGFSIAAFGTPVMVRSIRRARLLAEALIARGVAD
ncbi:energy-coupling factor transporter transmembrane protein EcfT [Corynebacterium testudinoris]|uniref:ABC-type cobalt transport system, permease component CbiQ n=1 Tax=Corynebacterium testudinoris TaxID=136857 RepID=A0A0G3HAR4_9CORY|nr:energy-coupling factor transporter transmembrane protein EcfT [Corynebacterium testudinoris]AKK09008.1 ABC-type cobalt transport system, permease component CbiQ [Corynebacterium testudinoris]MBX8995413.1 energy-coupling factor transporter transmembrane protein EcfT [Corynebacterium testudinoris]